MADVCFKILLDELLFVLFFIGLEGSSPENQFVSQDAQMPDIDFVVVLFALGQDQDLWRGVLQGSLVGICTRIVHCKR